MLGAVTIALKALLFPLGIGFVLRNLEADPRVPSVIGVPTSILLAIVLSGVRVHRAAQRRTSAAVAALPLSALPVAVAGVLVAFLLMVAAPVRALAAARLPGAGERGLGRAAS